MKTNFYRCNVCSNIAMKIYDSGLDMQCCGRDMECLDPQENEEEGMGEKHVPVCTIKDNKLTVRIGETEHPSYPEHYIDWVYVQTNRGGQLRYLGPEEAPQVSFHLSKKDRVEKVFAHCNVHGLWACECGC